MAGYHLEDLTRAFGGWLDSLQLAEPCVLVGHSLGGNLAVQYALANPGRVSALVLCDPFYSRGQLPALFRLGYGYADLLVKLLRHAPGWVIRVGVDVASLSIRNGYSLSREVRVQTAQDYQRSDPAVFAVINKMPDLTLRLKELRQPVLLLWGEKDQTLRPVSFSRLLDVIPRVEYAVIRGAGHVPHQSHAQEFNRLVLGFLAGQDEKKGRGS